jgi:hypothetical protein
MMISLVARFLHILAAALWMGSALFWPGAVRRALTLGPPHPAPALAQARVGLGLDLGLGLATLATGAALVFAAGGNAISVGVGFVLALLRVVLLLVLARPAVARIATAVAASDLDGARAVAKRVPAYAGMAHLLWVLGLAAMVFPL